MRLLLLFTLFCIQLNASPTDFNFICPGDITVNCTIDYSNLEQFGKAYVDHNGSIIWIKDCKVSYDINDCGYGTITRVWGVEDPNWKWLTCTQIITLSNANAFGEKDITWPRDVTIESCTPELDLKNIGRPYDRPVYKSNKCAKPMLNYSDSRHLVTNGCLKILRTWKILDWCVYDAYKNPSGGIFTHVQVIKLITVDTAAKINCSKEVIIDATTDCKGSLVKLDLAKVNSPCNMPYVIKNTSPYADSNAADASGFYPIGNHRFYYIAEYGCGKELKCETTVKVNSKIPPVPYCKDGVIVDLMPIDSDGNGTIDEGMIDIWAKDLDHGSYHPCPGQKLTYSFSSDITFTSKRFTCVEIGDNEVEIWITDSLGNQDHCKTKIIIQNNIGIPDCKKPDSLIHKSYSLNVTLTDVKDKSPVRQANLIVKNMNLNKKSLGEDLGFGHYQWKDLISDNIHSLDISISKFNRPKLGDLRWLESYLAGNELNANGYQILAADLNNDARVDYSDLQILKQAYFLKKSPVSMGFKCVPKEYKFSSDIQALTEFRNLDMMIPAHTTSNIEKNYLVIFNGIFNISAGITSGNNESLLFDSESFNQEFDLSYLTQSKQLYIRSHSELGQSSELKLYNVLGQLVYSNAFYLNGDFLLDLESSIISEGIYVLTLNNKLTKIYIRN